MNGDKKNSSRVLFLGLDLNYADELSKILGDDFSIRAICDESLFLKILPNFRPHLIILDLSGTGYCDLCRSLKNLDVAAETPVVAIGDEEKKCLGCAEVGMLDCMTKTTDPRILKLKLKKLVFWKQYADKLMESELKAGKRIEELESLIQMIAHDLKSPAMAIQGFVNLLRRKCSKIESDSKIDEILHYISAASISIQGFLNDLSRLLMSEHIELDFGRISLASIIDEVVGKHRQLIEEKSIDIDLDLGCSTMTLVLADERRIVQVLDNLLINAINYMGECSDARIRIYLREDQEFIITSVSDNGTGIPLIYQNKIFNRFFRMPGNQAKPGTGLGLSIAKTIIESHGGRLWVESEYGKGATFSFSIPKISPSAPAEKHCSSVKI